ncbi:PucR family transcriptional regulator [Kitasatospora sp. NPDC056138]|uniref:PucR family transcriptional regulator n=1 Tax=Kitasatospora sp. NPDC056138 TaxID=3345724 RepID=UPI0035D70A65
MTLEDLLADRSLGLRLLAEGDSPRAPVQWVHVSDLEDPTPFLEQGLVLLTTWLLPRDPAATDEYVRRLRAAGVCALGFGYDATQRLTGCPPELVEAARRHAMPLFEVPQSTPFIAVTRAVATALAAEENARSQALHRTAQELTRAAASDDGARRIVMQLAKAVDGWVVLASPTGKAVHASPHHAVRRLAQLGEQFGYLARTGPRTAAAVRVDDDAVQLQTLGVDRVRGLLVVGHGHELDSYAFAAIDTAACLLTVRLERSRGQYRAERRLHSAVLNLLLAGRFAEAEAVLGELAEQLPAPPLRVHLLELEPRRLDTVLLACAAAAARGREGQLSAAPQERPPQSGGSSPEPGRPAAQPNTLVVLATAGGHLEQVLPEIAARAEGVLGSSEPRELAGLTTGLAEAEQALTAARASGRAVRFEDLSRGRLLELLGEERMHHWAARVLRPLLEGEPEDLATVRAWLAHAGSLKDAAAELGVHRNTVRQRLQRIRQLVDHDLDDAVDRAELLIALQAIARAGTGNEPGRPG